MAGNKKKGRRKRSEQEKAKVANVPSSSHEDYKISDLKDLIGILVKEITGLREEKTILSTNLTEMVLEIESTRKMTEEWKEAQKELREELGKKDVEYQDNLLSKLGKLQTNLELMASDKVLLREKVRELKIEADSLKAQLLLDIEDAKKMTEEWKESDKELTEEPGKKDGEYQAAISEAGKQLQEAEERFNAKISAVNLDERSVEANVLHLKDEIQVISAELEETSKAEKMEKDMLLSQIVAAKNETAEIPRRSQLTQESWNTGENLLSSLEELQNLSSSLEELETKIQLRASEKGSLSETKREQMTEADSLKAQLVSEIESARKTTEEWKENEKELTKELGKKDGKYEAAISQAGKRLQKTEERFNTKISAKERECRAVNLDKTKLEATVLHLKNQIQVISAELEATSEHAKLERNVLLSQIVAAKKENAEKESLVSRLSETQAKLVLMASVNRSLTKTNRELRTEAEFLKAQLNEYNDKLVSMEDERQVLKTLSVSNAERLEALLQQNETMEKEITILQQRVDENVKQHADEIQQYKVAENSVKEQNQMLERQVSITSCLLGLRTKSFYEKITENVKLNIQVEWLSKKIAELQETQVKLMQEKDEQTREFQSLHADAVKKSKFMEEKHSELFKEKEEQAEIIYSLRGEINYLKQATKKNEDFSEKCSQIQHSTIAQEEGSDLVDTLNHRYVRNLADNQNPKPNDVNKMKDVQNNTKPSGGKQWKTQKWSSRK